MIFMFVERVLHIPVIFCIFAPSNPFNVMSMENMKLISIRIPEDDYVQLMQLCREYRWRDRSSLIRAAIRVMLACSKIVSMNRFVNFWPQWGDVVDTFEFTYHREHR